MEMKDIKSEAVDCRKKVIDIYNLLMDGKTCVARDKTLGLNQKLMHFIQLLQAEIEKPEVEYEPEDSPE